MATSYTFGENSTNVLSILTESYDSAGQIVLTAKYNGVDTGQQTLPAASGPRILAFNPETRNFYWMPLDPSIVQAGSFAVRNHDF